MSNPSNSSSTFREVGRPNAHGEELENYNTKWEKIEQNDIVIVRERMDQKIRYQNVFYNNIKDILPV